LYFFSGAREVLRVGVVAAAAGKTAVMAVVGMMS
jgi:hypothetical protein